MLWAGHAAGKASARRELIGIKRGKCVRRRCDGASARAV
jgi:hypothetical protein